MVHRRRRVILVLLLPQAVDEALEVNHQSGGRWSARRIDLKDVESK